MPDPITAARRAAMAQEIAQQARTAQTFQEGVPEDNAPFVQPYRRADDGGFDIFNPKQGMEKLAYVRENKVAMVTPDGEHVWIPREEAQAYADRGYQAESITEHHAREEQESIEASTSDAALGGFVSGFTGGASDVLLREYYGKAAARREGRIRAASPVAAGVAELVGFGTGLVAAAPEAVASAASRAGRTFAGQAARVRMPRAEARHLMASMLDDSPGALASMGRRQLAQRSYGTISPSGYRGRAKTIFRPDPMEGLGTRTVSGAGIRPGRLKGKVEDFFKIKPTGYRGKVSEAFKAPPRVLPQKATESQKRVAAALRKPGGRVEKRLFKELPKETRTSLERLAAREGLSPHAYVQRLGRRLGRRIDPVQLPPVDESVGMMGQAPLASRTMPPGPRPPAARTAPIDQRTAQEMIDALAGPSGVPGAEGALQSRLARIIARGAAEGAIYAGGREASEQALSGRDYEAAHIVEQAIQGAAWGSAMSMHGAGIGRVANQITSRLAGASRAALAKRAKLDVGRFETLLDRQTALVERLKFTTHPVQRANLQGYLKDTRKAILADRVKMFTAAGRGLSRLRLPLALSAAPLTYGFTLSNLMLGVAASAVPMILKTRLAVRGVTGLGRGLLRAGQTAKPFSAKVANLAVVGALTHDDAEQLAASLEATDAEEVGLAALQGYKLAGMDDGMASYLAEFQKRRVELLQGSIMRRPNSTNGVIAARILNAVEDPRRIAIRLAEGDILTEDLVALQYLFPEVYEELANQSRLMLERPGLTARQRMDLMKLAGTQGQVVQALQQAMQRPQQKAQSQPKAYNPSQDVASETQRLQGEKA